MAAEYYNSLDTNFTQRVLKELKNSLLYPTLFQFQYVHKWSPGDFIISDNLALGHEASPQTQLGDVL